MLADRCQQAKGGSFHRHTVQEIESNFLRFRTSRKNEYTRSTCMRFDVTDLRIITKALKIYLSFFTLRLTTYSKSYNCFYTYVELAQCVW